MNLTNIEVKRRKPKCTKGNFLKNIIGLRFAKLVITLVNENKYGFVNAICDCGVEKEFLFQNVKTGKTLSCGCLQREICSKRMKEYNEVRVPRPTKGEKVRNGISFHPLHGIWLGMRNRCYKPHDISYPRYGGKGVIMCEEWKNSYRVFYEWGILNGWQKGLQIDKDIKAKEMGIEPLLYSPERCQFVTRSENCRLRTTSNFIEYNGMTKTLAEWCEVYSISHSCYIGRISRGWSIQKSLETKSFKNKTA